MLTLHFCYFLKNPTWSIQHSKNKIKHRKTNNPIELNDSADVDDVDDEDEDDGDTEVMTAIMMMVMVTRMMMIMILIVSLILMM